MPDTKKKIAFAGSESLPEEYQAKIAAAVPDYDLLDLSKNPSDEEIAACEILFGHVKPDIIKKMPRLKWVHAHTAGVEMFLNPETRLSNDIILTNSSGAFGISIAEHMLTVTLMLLRNTVSYLTQQREHTWKSIDTRVRNLHDCTVTVVGLGDIGGRYAQLCHALGAQVNGVVRTVRADKPQYVHRLFTADRLGEAIKNAHVVALALPGTGETAGILSSEHLKSMRQGAYIVNVGRGSAIDQDAMTELLQSGHLGGAALDVTVPEPLPATNPLWDMPNVIITPHVSQGGYDNVLELITDRFTRYLKDYINGRPFGRVVDRDAGY